MSQNDQDKVSAPSEPERAAAPASKSGRYNGMRLPVQLGARMALEFATLDKDDALQRVAGDLVGVVHFEFLIVRLPRISGLLSRLLPGCRVTVRFMADGQLSGFQAEIVTHTNKPGLIVFLSYPDVVEMLPLRQHKRVHCVLPVFLHGRRGDSKAVIADLSRSGCKLVLDTQDNEQLRETTVGDELVLRGTFSAEGGPQAVKSTVRAVELPAKSKMALGVVFLEPDKPFLDSVDEFMASSLLLG